MSAVFARLNMLIFIAWRNVWRNPIRSVLTVSALAGGLIMLILYYSLMAGISQQMIRFATEISTGRIQVQRLAFIQDQDLYATIPWHYLTQLEQQNPSLQFAPRLYAAALASHQESSTGVQIMAVDSQRERQVTKLLTHVRQGQMNLEQAIEQDGMVYAPLVLGYQLARNMGVTVGDELVLVSQAADGSIGNDLFRVAGILKPINPTFDRMGVLMSIESYKALMYLETGIHEIIVNFEFEPLQTSNSEDGLSQLQRLLMTQIMAQEQAQPLDKLGGKIQVRNWREVAPSLSKMLALSHSMMLVIGVVVMGLASLGMLNTMLMAVHERRQEFAILRAIGMKRRWLLLMVSLESLFLALISAVMGSLFGTWMSLRFEQHGIDFSASMPDGYDWAGMVFEPVMYGLLLPEHIYQSCLLMLLISMLASLFPAWLSTHHSPAESMR